MLRNKNKKMLKLKVKLRPTLKKQAQICSSNQLLSLGGLLPFFRLVIHQLQGVSQETCITVTTRREINFGVSFTVNTRREINLGVSADFVSMSEFFIVLSCT
jgi:hypothetical protein